MVTGHAVGVTVTVATAAAAGRAAGPPLTKYPPGALTVMPGMMTHDSGGRHGVRGWSCDHGTRPGRATTL